MACNDAVANPASDSTPPSFPIQVTSLGMNCHPKSAIKRQLKASTAPKALGDQEKG